MKTIIRKDSAITNQFKFYNYLDFQEIEALLGSVEHCELRVSSIVYWNIYLPIKDHLNAAKRK